MLGGGLYLLASSGVISRNTVSTNQATGTTVAGAGLGGGIYISGGAPQITANTIDGNKTTGTPLGRGGGLYLAETAALVQDNQISNNTSFYGGGLYLDGTTTAAVLHNTISNNVAILGSQSAPDASVVGGGGIYLASTVISLTENTLIGNEGTNGGGLYVNGSGANVLFANTVVSNTADQNGGGVYLRASNALMQNNAVHNNNTSKGSGGGIYATLGAVRLAQNDISNNAATLDGGGIYLNQDNATVLGGAISENQGGNGGGVYVLDASGASDVATALLEAITVQNNRATNNGGGLYFHFSRARVEGLMVAENSANSNGGGVYIDQSMLADFERNVIRNNGAGNGGGIVLTKNSNPTLASNAVIDNHAANEGGGIYITGSSPTLAFTTLARNGVGLAVDALDTLTSTVTLVNSIIAGHDLGISAAAGTEVSLQGTLWDGNQTDSLGPGAIQQANDLHGNANFAADGYHLLPNSDAASAGVQTDLSFGGDIDGQSRFQGNGPELGADELLASCAIVVATDLNTVYTDLQTALDKAPRNGTVLVAGTCTGLHTRNGTTQLAYIDKNITLRGGYAPGEWQVSYPVTQPTVLDAGQGLQGNARLTGRTVYVTGDIQVALENMSLLGGNAAGLGGGPQDVDAGGNIFVSGAQVTIRNCSISGGAAADGGGIYLRTGTATVTNNDIRYNHGSNQGGGIFVDNGSTGVSLRNNQIGNNTATNGGGIFVAGGTLTLDDNRITGNDAATIAGNGGGLFIQNSPAAVYNNQILGNRAAMGGGIYAQANTPDLYNNILARNSAGADGSAIYLVDAPVRLRQDTLVDNQVSAGSSGSAIVVTAQGTTPIQVQMVNSIIVGSTSGVTVTAGNDLLIQTNLWYDNKTNWGGAGSVVQQAGNLFVDPAFVSRSGGDYHLTAGSPAIDQGINAGISFDIDNQPRPGRLGFDIGADEYLTPSIRASLDALPDPVAAGGKLTYIIQVVNSGDVDLVANIKALIPSHVTATGPTQWADIAIAHGSAWTKNLVVNVPAQYTGPLNATLQVTTNQQGVTATAVNNATAANISSQVLEVAGSASPNPVTPGAILDYIVRVTNHGGIALNATVSVTLPATVSSLSPLTWTPVIAGNDGNWTATFTGTVSAKAAGALRSRIQVDSLEGASSAYTFTTGLAKPGVAATRAATPHIAEAGSSLLYHIGVTNTGNVPLNAQITNTLSPHLATLSGRNVQTWTVPLSPQSTWSQVVTTSVEAGYTGPLAGNLQVTTDAGVTAFYSDVVQSQRPTFTFAASARGGDWYDPNSWNPPAVPQPDDIVHIPAKVTIFTSRPITTGVLINEGTLRFLGQSGQVQSMAVVRVLENYGTIVADNGTNPGDSGVGLDIQVGSLYNEGTIRSGNGLPNGGAGGHLTINADNLTNRGTLVAGNGAPVTDSTANIGGGAGGDLIIATNPGRLSNAGRLAAGHGGDSNPATTPPQSGGRGGNLTLLSVSSVVLDNSQVNSGQGGAGSVPSQNGTNGEIFVGANTVSSNQVQYSGKATVIQSGQTVYNFTTQAPPTVVTLNNVKIVNFFVKIFNRGSVADTYVVSAMTPPSGWKIVNLPALITIGPFRSSYVLVSVILPGGVQAAASMDTIQIVVTSQRNSADQQILPVQVIEANTPTQPEALSTSGPKWDRTGHRAVGREYAGRAGRRAKTDFLACHC